MEDGRWHTIWRAGRFSILNLLSSFSRYRRWRVFVGNRAKADDVFDGVGYTHVEFGEFLLRHQNEKAGGRIGRGRDKDTDETFAGLLLDFTLLFAGDKANGIISRPRKFHQDDGLERMF